MSWIRIKLGLTQLEVSKETMIPYSSYNDREANVRTDNYEEMIVLAAYFNNLWQKKYSKLRYPELNGEQVKAITPMLLMFGSDDVERDHELVKSRLLEKISEMRAQSDKKQAELDKQLEMFKEIG